MTHEEIETQRSNKQTMYQVMIQRSNIELFMPERFICRTVKKVTLSKVLQVQAHWRKCCRKNSPIIFCIMHK